MTTKNNTTIQAEEPELIPAQPDCWTVVPRYADELKQIVKHYELRYRGTVQDKRKGLHSYEVLRLTAKHLNRVGAVPRPRVMCAADSDNPSAYLLKHV